MQITEPFKWLRPALEEFAATADDVQLVCQFVGAKPQTVQRWIADDNPAQGANELRLWHFLLAAGHTFDKLRIAEFNFYLAELFAYRVLDGLDDVQQYAGVKNPQTALQIMRGQPPMSPAVTLEEMQELHDEQLQLAKSELKQTLRVRIAPGLPALPTPSTTDEMQASGLDALIPIFAGLLKAVGRLSDIALNSMTPEQRSQLRAQVGDQEMFELSNQFHALCGERVRSQHQERM